MHAEHESRQLRSRKYNRVHAFWFKRIRAIWTRTYQHIALGLKDNHQADFTIVPRKKFLIVTDATLMRQHLTTLSQAFPMLANLSITTTHVIDHFHCVDLLRDGYFGDLTVDRTGGEGKHLLVLLDASFQIDIHTLLWTVTDECWMVRLKDWRLKIPPSDLDSGSE